jgi:flagellar basal-body rod protein FlgG
VAQGFLEAANVEVVTEMVNMIEAQRQFEAYTKVMQSTDSLDKEAIQRVSKARA